MKIGENKRQSAVLLSIQKALLDEIVPHLRAVQVDWNLSNEIVLYFFFDELASDNDFEGIVLVAKKMQVDFPENGIRTKYYTFPLSKKIKSLGRVYAFARKGELLDNFI